MLPHQGQGGGMAIEDGGALSILLSALTSKSQITERLRLFQETRFERASAVQILSNAAYDEVERMKDEVAKYVKGQMPRNQTEIHEFFFSYNVLDDTRHRLRELREPEEKNGSMIG